MNQVTIVCKDVTKKFGIPGKEVLTLRGINLVAHENELIMLMGPSGSGKTTLISIIGGILKQDSGEVIVLGKPINSLPEAEKTAFRGKNIGFMFQNFDLVPTLTCIENVSIPLLLAGDKREDALTKASDFLFTLGLDEQRFRFPNELSGGEQQRVAIGRATIMKPKIILCDEPTSFLDRERGKKIMELLHQIKIENQCTLIIVSHDPRILEFADTILEIEDGMIKKRNPNEPLLGEPL